jgi:hypothetical protein
MSIGNSHFSRGWVLLVCLRLVVRRRGSRSPRKLTTCVLWSPKSPAAVSAFAVRRPGGGRGQRLWEKFAPARPKRKRELPALRAAAVRGQPTSATSANAEVLYFQKRSFGYMTEDRLVNPVNPLRRMDEDGRPPRVAFVFAGNTLQAILGKNCGSTDRRRSAAPTVT